MRLATGPSYRVAFRRRREEKTDYQLRRALILSGLPRLVARGSLRNITAQMVKADVKGDKVLVASSSTELAKKYSWLGDTGTVSAAYLTGLLCGYKAMGQGIKEAVLDIGLSYPSRGSKIFAVLKGALDAGLSIPSDEEKLPDKKRITGQDIAEYAKQLSSSTERYQKQFSALLARGLRPEEITAHFEQVKEKIASSLKTQAPPEETPAESLSNESEGEFAKEEGAEEE